MEDETPPKESTGQADRGREAERAVDGQSGSEDKQREPDVSAVPKSGQSPGETKGPPTESGHDNEKLRPQKSILLRTARSEPIAFWTLVTTVGLAAATFALAVATADMARSTRQLANLAGQQAKDTQDALEVSRRQAAAAERANDLAESAQVSVAIGPFSPPVVNTKLTGTYSAFDVGHEPAINVTAQSLLTIATPPKIPDPLPVCSSCNKAILFPTQAFQGNSLNFSSTLPSERITQDLIDKVKLRQAVIFLTGRVDFEDDKIHHTVFLCEFFDPDTNQLAPCSLGNRYTTVPASDWTDVTLTFTPKRH